MEEKLKETAKKSIEKILDEGLNTNNLEHLYKLIDIYFPNFSTKKRGVPIHFIFPKLRCKGGRKYELWQLW